MKLNGGIGGCCGRNACSLGLGYGDGRLFGSGGFIPVLVFGVLGSFLLTGRRLGELRVDDGADGSVFGEGSVHVDGDLFGGAFIAAHEANAVDAGHVGPDAGIGSHDRDGRVTLDSSGGFGDAQRSGRVVEDHQHAGVLEMRSDHGLRIGGVADDDRDVELVEFGGEVMILNDGDDGRACLVKLGGERRQQAALARDDDLVVKLFGGRFVGDAFEGCFTQRGGARPGPTGGQLSADGGDEAEDDGVECDRQNGGAHDQIDRVVGRQAEALGLTDENERKFADLCE